MKSSTTARSLTLSLIVVALFVAGCSSTYEMKVDAINNPKTVGESDSYVIVPSDPDTDTTDLRYQETVEWIKTALSGKGMYEAVDPMEADMMIEVDFGMKAPRQEAKIIDRPSSVGLGTGGLNRGVGLSGGSRITEISTYETKVVTQTVVEKYLELTAKENMIGQAGDAPPQQIWNVRVVNDDKGDNLREYMPILIASATDYIGEDTVTSMDIELKSDDEVVKFVKRGIINAPPPETTAPESTPAK